MPRVTVGRLTALLILLGASVEICFYTWVLKHVLCRACRTGWLLPSWAMLPEREAE